MRKLLICHAILGATAILFIGSGVQAQGTGTPLDCQELAQTLGGQTSTTEEVCKVTMPRPDLDVTLMGTKLPVPMGLASWAAFTPTGPDKALVMGDLVLRTGEFPTVIKALREHGIEITAVHSHMMGEEPELMYMHYQGVGSAAELARNLNAALSGANALGGSTAGEEFPDEATVAGVTCSEIVEALAVESPSVVKAPGMCKVTLPRAELDVTMRESAVPAGLGLATWMAFKETGDGKALVVGDFALKQEAVNPAVSALLEHGILVVRLHNHMLFEEPRVMFFHFQAKNEPLQLAKGLRAGLEAAYQTDAQAPAVQK